jgi:hypothetical protein
MSVARRSLGSCGLQTAALAFGGDTPPGDNYVTSTEEFTGGGPATLTVGTD